MRLRQRAHRGVQWEAALEVLEVLRMLDVRHEMMHHLVGVLWLNCGGHLKHLTRLLGT